MKKESIWQYLKPYRKESFASPILKMTEATFELFVPLVVAKIVDIGIPSGDDKYLVNQALLMVLLAFVGTTVALFAQYFAAKAATGFSANLREALFKRILGLSFEDLDRFGTGALLTRMNSDIAAVQSAVNLFLRLLLRSPFIVAGAVVMATFVDRSSLPLFLGVVAVLGIIVFIITKCSLPAFRIIQEKLEILTLTTRETIDGQKVIRAFCRENAELERINNNIGEVYSAQKHAGNIQSFINPVTYLVINTGLILLIYVSGVKVQAGNLTAGQTLALINYMSQILVELIKLSNLIVLIMKAAPCVVRLEEVLFGEDENVQMSLKKEAKNGDSINHKEDENGLEFQVKNLSFTYAGAAEESLSDISFDVRKGETIVIIGGTGSGKSTLLDLLSGFYSPEKGEILFRGKNICDYEAGEVFSQLSRVPQKAQLFSGTIESNLKVGGMNATKEEMKKALSDACALEFVSEKGGLSAEVLSKGSNFSGGQKQRLTIARALSRKAPVLMLDDSFSALDMATEKTVATNVSNLPDNPTTFIVSQRASSLRFADKILVLEDGMVAGFGTMAQLMENCEIFKEIYRTQYEEVANE